MTLDEGEVVITPEMLDAGCKEAANDRRPIEDYVRAIYTAMKLAEDGE